MILLIVVMGWLPICGEEGGAQQFFIKCVVCTSSRILSIDGRKAHTLMLSTHVILPQALMFFRDRGGLI